MAVSIQIQEPSNAAAHQRTGQYEQDLLPRERKKSNNLELIKKLKDESLRKKKKITGEEATKPVITF